MRKISNYINQLFRNRSEVSCHAESHESHKIFASLSKGKRLMFINSFQVQLKAVGLEAEEKSRMDFLLFYGLIVFSSLCLFTHLMTMSVVLEKYESIDDHSDL